jgi:hypothetical protein
MREEAEEVVVLLCRFRPLQQLACHRVAAALTLTLTPQHNSSTAANGTTSTAGSSMIAMTGSAAEVSMHLKLHSVTYFTKCYDN